MRWMGQKFSEPPGPRDENCGEEFGERPIIDGKRSLTTERLIRLRFPAAHAILGARAKKLDPTAEQQLQPSNVPVTGQRSRWSVDQPQVAASPKTSSSSVRGKKSEITQKEDRWEPTGFPGETGPFPLTPSQSRVVCPEGSTDREKGWTQNSRRRS